MMSTRLHTQVQAAPTPTLTPARPGVLQRKCTCVGSSGTAGGCSECTNVSEDLALQRVPRELERTAPNAVGVPSIVYDVLRSPGQSLDAETSGFMESRFGHDFSRVRVHTDRRAAES